MCCLRPCPLQHCAGVNAVALSADEQRLWTGSRDSVIAWWVVEYRILVTNVLQGMVLSEWQGCGAAALTCCSQPPLAPLQLGRHSGAAPSPAARACWPCRLGEAATVPMSML